MTNTMHGQGAAPLPPPVLPRINHGARTWLSVARWITAGYVALGVILAIVLGTHSDNGPHTARDGMPYYSAATHPFVGVAIAVAAVVFLTGGVVFAVISAMRAKA